ncbi:carbonic anhydrase [Pelosinus fermentans]|uniref:Carbonic anhydrase n=1 Tax=Pelosinus fermentans JBW45 TaxID=1192197 RepID=I8U4Y1_9FIRM|nr:carbonic anhydrase [Pelosinus fermentans]AJQ27501.1 carbonic anhydrase [Pelosinus fermentans JBW45]
MRKPYLSILFTLLITIFLITPVLASSSAPSISAEVAEKMLIDGNKRFLSEKYADREIGKTRRIELTKGQHPFAVIVSCSDSRVAPELLFDQGLGELFVVRVAGNVLDAIELGSVEYAVEHLGAKLIVVLGHEKCGAVKATVDGGELPPNIKVIADKIQPAVAAAKAKHSDNVYEATTDANIINMVASLNSDHVITHVEGVKFLGAKYHLESGEVEFIK